MFDDATWRRRLSEMTAILESDRAFLLSGQIEKLARQDQRRGAIEAKLYEMPQAVAKAEVRKIELLKRLAARNHRLLNAYLEGARRAAQHLAALEQTQGLIGVYRRDGSRVTSTIQRSTTQVRA